MSSGASGDWRTRDVQFNSRRSLAKRAYWKKVNVGAADGTSKRDDDIE